MNNCEPILNYTITRFPNFSIFLPFSCFHHFADFALHQIALEGADVADVDRKSTRLNSSHLGISYAVFCLSGVLSFLHSFPTRRSSDLIFLPFSCFHHFADFALHQIALEGADVADVELRSEERRVGKECRSRWSRDQ